MSAPNLKLIYFDIRGLGELSRLCLAAGGLPFTDDRIEFTRKPDGTFHRPDWEVRKKDMPYGQVPVLEVNGVKIAQSNAIVRYVARIGGLMGSNDLEAALIDAGYEAILDSRKQFFEARGNPEKTADFWKNKLPEAMLLLEKNAQSDKHFVGDKISITDMSIYYTFFVLATENKEAIDSIMAKCTKLHGISENVKSNERVAKYLASRKVTPM